LLLFHVLGVRVIDEHVTHNEDIPIKCSTKCRQPTSTCINHATQCTLHHMAQPPPQPPPPHISLSRCSVGHPATSRSITASSESTDTSIEVLVSDCASLSSGDMRNIISLDTAELSALCDRESPRTSAGIDVLRTVGPRRGDDGEPKAILSPPILRPEADGRSGGDTDCHPLPILGETGLCR
jgi:hypothetical protein